MSVRFEWDVNKATANETKHNVSLAEAATVFRDPIAATFDDEAHSNEERREFIIGHSDRFSMLLRARRCHPHYQCSASNKKGTPRL